jgi:hypothetical protein
MPILIGMQRGRRNVIALNWSSVTTVASHFFPDFPFRRPAEEGMSA